MSHKRNADNSVYPKPEKKGIPTKTREITWLSKTEQYINILKHFLNGLPLLNLFNNL